MINDKRIANFDSGIFIDRIRRKVPDEMNYMHVHNYHELYFLLSGARRYFIGDTIYDVSAGDLVVIPRNELHRTSRMGSQGYERFLINFPDENTKALRSAVGSEKFDKFLKSGCVQLPAEKREQLKTLFTDIERELSAHNQGAYLIANGKLNEIIITAMRHGTPKLHEKEKTVERIQKVARYVSKNFHNPISLNDVARMAYLEDAYFSKQFKRITGFCFAEYLTQVRIKEAMTLLETTKLSVSDIALQCGFSSGNYFGDVFRRAFGMSPSEYRKKVAETI